MNVEKCGILEHSINSSACCNGILSTSKNLRRERPLRPRERPYEKVCSLRWWACEAGDP
jgi:hypothetical protein